MPIVSQDAEKVPELSSRVPLSNGLSFTSPWIKLEKYANIRVGCYTDKSGELHTQHSNDNGITIIRDSNQPISANKAEFLSFHPRADYFRVVMKNTGGADQTFLDLSTHIDSVAYGVTQSEFSAPLGRTSFGIQARSVLYDYNYDETAIITPFIRDLVTVTRIGLFADPFNDGALDPILWASSLTGTGAAAVVNNKLQLLTGATANSTAKVNSMVRGRFVAGNLQSSRSGIRTPDAGTANNKRRWGPYDANNGFFFELDGTVLYAVGRLAGVDTRVASTAWNKISTFAYMAATDNSFEVSFWADVAFFLINGEVHHILYNNTGLRGSYPNTFENINYGGSITNVELDILGTFQQRYGPSTEQPRFYNITGAATTVLKQSAGHLDKIIIGSGGTGSITIYDNTVASGVVIVNLSGITAPLDISLGVDYSTGLTVVTTGAATDVTVVFA